MATKAVLTTSPTENTVTSQSVAALTLDLEAGVTYAIQGAFFLSQSVTADGARLDLDGGTVTATTFIGEYLGWDTSTLRMIGSVTTLADDATAANWASAGMVQFTGTIVVNAGGTLIPRFALEAASTGVLTLQAGSWLIATRLT